jgi:hypothetical protein
LNKEPPHPDAHNVNSHLQTMWREVPGLGHV